MKAYGKRLPIGSKVKLIKANNLICEIVGVERIKPNLRWRSVYQVMLPFNNYVMTLPPSSVRRYLAVSE